jgi:hypothetical protein
VVFARPGQALLDEDLDQDRYEIEFDQRVSW